MEINSDAISKHVKNTAAEAAPAQALSAPEASCVQEQPTAKRPMPQTQEAAIKEMLLANGFKASEENIKIAAALLEGQLPLNRENLQKLTQGLRLLGIDIETGKIEEAIFMLKNGIQPTAKNAEMLRSYLDGNIKIMSQLESLMGAIKELPDGVLRENILKALLGGDMTKGLVADKAILTVPQDVSAQNQAGGQLPQAGQSQSGQVQIFGDAAAQSVARNVTTQSNLQNPTSGLLPAEQQSEGRQLGDTTNTQSAAQTATQENISTKIGVSSSAARGISTQPGQLAQSTQGESPTRQADAMTGTQNQNPAQEASARESSSAQGSATPREISTQEQTLVQKDLTSQGKSLSSKESSDASNIRDAAAQNTTAEAKDSLFAQVKQRLFFDPSGTNNKDIDEFLNRLRDRVEDARVELLKSGAPETARLMRELTFIKESLEFINHIKENIYLQLPISVHNHESNGEILVFLNKKSRKQSDGSVSALIALDTLNLGRYEVYVQKTGKSVSCQFRLRDEDIERLTRANLPRLQTMLQSQGYSLTDVTYKKAEESFTMLGKLQDEISIAMPREKMAFDVRM